MKNKPYPALLRPSNLSNEIKKRGPKSCHTIPLRCKTRRIVVLKPPNFKLKIMAVKLCLGFFLYSNPLLRSTCLNGPALFQSFSWLLQWVPKVYPGQISQVSAVLRSRSRSRKEPHLLVGAGAVTRCGSGSDNGITHS
jgi:hypothetical protein